MTYPKIRGMGLEHNGPFWARYIDRVFLTHLRTFEEAVFGRILPSFESIADEADQRSEEAWEEVASRAAPGTDPSDLAEAAAEAAIEYFERANAVGQAVRNVIAVALHHLLEQQQLLLLRRELLPKSEEEKEIDKVGKEFVAALQEQGVDPESYECWEVIRDLHYAANAIKHGEGWSADELKERRPDLLVYPPFRGDELHESSVEVAKIEKPLAGEDLYVADYDLQEFFSAVHQFWERLAEDFLRVADFRS